MHMAILLILHQKLTTYAYAQYRALYVIFPYNFWVELTLSSLVSRLELVTM